MTERILEIDDGHNESQVALNYATMQGNHCVTGSFRNIFSFLNIDLRECEIFILGEGFNIFYGKSDEGIGYIETQFNIEGLRNNCAVEFEFTRNTDLNVLEDTINRNRPVLVQVNSAFLDHHPIFKSNKGRKHFIVVYGIDKADNKAYISDSYILNNTYPTSYSGSTSMDTLLQAIEAGGGICYRIKGVDCKKNTAFEWQEIIKKNINGYLSCESKDYQLSAGLNAMVDLYNNICDNIELSDEAALITYFRDVAYSLKVLGFITGKYFLKDMLLKYYDPTSINTVINRLSSINRGWSNICLLFMKNAIAKDKARLAEVAIMFKKNTEQEQALLEELVSMRVIK